MKVKVIRAEVLTGISKQTNEPYVSTKVTVIFPTVPGSQTSEGTKPENAVFPSGKITVTFVDT